VSHHSGQQLTEDEQIKIAKRIGLIQHLPIHQFTDDNFNSKKVPSECDICMNDFVVGTYTRMTHQIILYESLTIFFSFFFLNICLLGDSIRYLPCMHQYHVQCVDNWLMRSLTCPSCCEPVDAGLLTSFETI
jgi:E3 ubiquitin-protein ligase RNF11